MTDEGAPPDQGFGAHVETAPSDVPEPEARVAQAEYVLEAAQTARSNLDAKYEKIKALVASEADAIAQADAAVAEAQAELEDARAAAAAAGNGSAAPAEPAPEPTPEG